MKVNKFARGQIWWYETTTTYDGNVQGKSRPVIIISNHKANENSNNVTVIPCTTKVKSMYLPTHIRFYLNDIQNIALCENILTINKQKLTQYEGTCDIEIMNKIENGIKIALGLIDVPVKSLNITEKEIDSINPIEINNSSESVENFKHRGRQPKYNKEEMKKFVKDYDTQTIDYMLKTYNECSQKAVQSKVYRFRKILDKENNQ